MDVMKQEGSLAGRNERLAPIPAENIERFLADLTALSRRHGIAIADDPHTFVMDREDYDSAYSLDEGSRVRFG